MKSVVKFSAMVMRPRVVPNVRAFGARFYTIDPLEKHAD